MSFGILEAIAAKFMWGLGGIAGLLGVKIPVLIWSAIGAIISAFLREGSLCTRVLSAIVGFFFANSTGPFIAHLMAYWSGIQDDTASYSAGFIGGMTGMVIVEGFIRAAIQFRTHFPRIVDRKMGS